MREYTVKEVGQMAGVSVRTLHYYDEIELLLPAMVGENGYRYYDDGSLLRLQQILFFKELGFELDAIKALLDHPDFDVIAALRDHRAGITVKIERLMTLLDTIDRTIDYVTGVNDMSGTGLFHGFSDEEQAAKAEEAAQEWDAETVRASQERWQGYGKAKQEAIKQEGNAIYAGLAGALTAGAAADSAKVQAFIGQWHAHLRYFYEPTVDALRGLSELYVTDERFKANIGKLHPGLPLFMQEAITHYCDTLE